MENTISENEAKKPAIGALKLRTAGGAERSLDPGIGIYCWHSEGLKRATELSMDELHVLVPDFVILHSGSADLLQSLRASVEILEKVVFADAAKKPLIWCGLGIDGSLGAWRAGKITSEQIISRYVAVAALCERIGIETLLLNGEQWMLTPGSVRMPSDVHDLADGIGREVSKAAPSLVLGLSTYGRLGYHADVRSLIEGLTPYCSFFTGQSYAARSGPSQKGVLPAVLAADEKSQDATVRQGWMRPDEETGAEEEDFSSTDLDRIPTLQGYKTDLTDLCRALCENRHVLLWSLPMLDEKGRFDENGCLCVLAAKALRADSLPGKKCVIRYQRINGLTADRKPGPETRAHAIRKSREKAKEISTDRYSTSFTRLPSAPTADASATKEVVTETTAQQVNQEFFKPGYINSEGELFFDPPSSYSADSSFLKNSDTKEPK